MLDHITTSFERAHNRVSIRQDCVSLKTEKILFLRNWDLCNTTNRHWTQVGCIFEAYTTLKLRKITRERETWRIWGKYIGTKRKSSRLKEWRLMESFLEHFGMLCEGIQEVSKHLFPQTSTLYILKGMSIKSKSGFWVISMG